MKKNIVNLLESTLIIGFYTGCSSTPDKPPVKIEVKTLLGQSVGGC